MRRKKVQSEETIFMTFTEMPNSRQRLSISMLEVQYSVSISRDEFPELNFRAPNP